MTLYISYNIITLSHQLLYALKNEECSYKIIITKHGVHYQHEEINMEIEQEQPIEKHQEKPQPTPIISPLPIMIKVENKIVNGIQLALDKLDSTICSSKLTSNIEVLTNYFTMLDISHYTQNSVYFEIGCVLNDLIADYPLARQQKEACNIVRRCVSTSNLKQKTSTALRIYSYFQQNPGYVLLKNLDQHFRPSAIGRMSEYASNRLKARIN